MLAITKTGIRETSRIAGELLFGILACALGLLYVLALPRVLISGLAGFWFLGGWGAVAGLFLGLCVQALREIALMREENKKS